MDLTGKFLIAMPGMLDDVFKETLIYMTKHTEDHSEGLVLNRTTSLTLNEILGTLKMPLLKQDQSILWGGPVIPDVGVFLHDGVGEWNDSFEVAPGIWSTGSVDLLKSYAAGRCPQINHLAAFIGRASWGPGQLESEIAEDTWLTAPADQTIMFEMNPALRYDAALASIGADPGVLTSLDGAPRV